MNARQLFEKVQEILQAAVWAGGSEPVFHDRAVMVTAYTDPSEALKRAPAPLAVIRPGNATVDPEADEEPGLISQEFIVTLVTRNPNDAIGEAALLGGASPDGRTTSENRGLLEVEEELLRAGGFLDGVSGVTIMARAKSAPEAIIDDEYGYVVWRDYLFEALVTSEAE